MGILNRLWSKVWNAEEAKKRAEADKIMTDASIRAAEIRAKKTPVQEAAMKHGGAEEEYHWSSMQQFGQAAQQSQYKQMLAQQASTTGYGGIGTGTSPHQASSTYVQLGMGGGIGTGGMGSLATLHTAPVYGYPTLGNSHRDIFFMALRGIEEAAMNSRNKEDNFRYDDFAVSLMDMRYFDHTKISLLGLASFCLSNLMEVEPVVILLEGHGMTVVDE